MWSQLTFLYGICAVLAASTDAFGSSTHSGARTSRRDRRIRTKNHGRHLLHPFSPSLEGPKSFGSSSLSATTSRGAMETSRQSQSSKPSMNNREVEQNIVRLGRRGQTNEALELFRSLHRPKSIRIWNAAIDACARARPTRLKEAFAIFQELIDESTDLDPNVFTFGALMSACSRARQTEKAIDLLRSMKSDYGVTPNAVVYSSAISACARSEPTPKWEKALELLEECTATKISMNVVGYNAALGACAQAGQWEAAIQLLEEMPSDYPDAISYGTVLMACERGEAWEMLLSKAREMEERDIGMDTLSVTSCLHACQRLGLADEALRYLELCKQAPDVMERQTAGWERTGARQPLNGPDDVAYRLAISACARGHAHQAGLDLLDEMQELGLNIDVVACTSAITGCEYAGEWRKACVVLDKMRKANIEPNEVTMAAIIAACATACAITDDAEERRQAKLKAIQLWKDMKADPNSVKPSTAVFNALIRTCAESLDLELAFRVMYDLQEQDGLEPTIVTYGTLMTACERVGSLRGMKAVLQMIREHPNGIAPNEIIYGAAISTCRKAGEPELCMLLLRKMIKDGLHPNLITLHTVLMAQFAGHDTNDLDNALLIYKLIDSNTVLSEVKPNRQTFNIVIRSLAARKQPKTAEWLIRTMIDRGLRPDVELYTSTVSAYERTGQPRKALKLMESMQRDGYDFYDIPVLNAAFSKAIKIVNSVVGATSTGEIAVALDERRSISLLTLSNDDVLAALLSPKKSIPVSIADG